MYKSAGRSDYFPVIISLLTLTAGIVRMIQGYQNDRPIAYLAAMCVIAFIILMIIVVASSGEKILQQLFKDNFANEGNAAYPSAAMASAFVFLGLGSLAPMDGYYNLNNTFSKQRNNNSGSWGGDGGSGCGSDGGSSCGGGGCGGCGGGD